MKAAVSCGTTFKKRARDPPAQPDRLRALVSGEMQFYSLQTTADRATLELREAPIPEPAAAQVLLRMRAASLNRGEFILGHGLQKTGTSKAIRIEGAGEIAKAG